MQIPTMWSQVYLISHRISSCWTRAVTPWEELDFNYQALMCRLEIALFVRILSWTLYLSILFTLTRPSIIWADYIYTYIYVRTLGIFLPPPSML